MFTNKFYYQLNYYFQKALDDHGVKNILLPVRDCDDVYCGCAFW